MGTNYFLELDVCECCGHSKKRKAPLHIGKNSCGWRFSFQIADPKESWNDYPHSVQGWRELIAKDENLIYDEYGDPWDKDAFWEMVESTLQGKVLTQSDLSFGKPSDYETISPEGYRISTTDFS